MSLAKEEDGVSVGVAGGGVEVDEEEAAFMEADAGEHDFDEDEIDDEDDDGGAAGGEEKEQHQRGGGAGGGGRSKIDDLIAFYKKQAEALPIAAHKDELIALIKRNRCDFNSCCQGTIPCLLLLLLLRRRLLSL